MTPGQPPPEPPADGPPVDGAPAAHPPRIQRLIEGRSLQVAAPDVPALVGVWRKALHSAADAAVPGVGLDNAVDLAYKAALQAAHALLESHGYRVKSGQGHHYATFYALGTLDYRGLKALADRFDAHRQRRAAAVYDPEPAVLEDLTQLRAAVAELLPVVHRALVARHPERAEDLLPPGSRPPPPGPRMRERP